MCASVSHATLCKACCYMRKWCTPTLLSTLFDFHRFLMCVVWLLVDVLSIYGFLGIGMYQSANVAQKLHKNAYCVIYCVIAEGFVYCYVYSWSPTPIYISLSLIEVTYVVNM